MAKHKAVFMGRWTLEVDHHDPTGGGPVEPIGYATEKSSAKTFRTYDGKQFFPALGWGPPPSVRKKLAAMMRSEKTTRRNPSKYRRELVRGRKRSQFARSSFRTISIGRGGNKALVACPKGAWDKNRKRCRKGMRAYELLIRRGVSAPRVSKLKTRRR